MAGSSRKRNPSSVAYKNTMKWLKNKRRRAQARANRFGKPVKVKDGSSFVEILPA